MRVFVVLLTLLLAGCGSSSAAKPTATAVSNQTGRVYDRASGLLARVDRVVVWTDHALLHVTLRNLGATPFQSPPSPQFLNTAYVEPTSTGVTNACDADTSRGAPLDYQSVPAHATHTGWIRCDYPQGSHIFLMIWLDHALGGYRIVQ